MTENELSMGRKKELTDDDLWSDENQLNILARDQRGHHKRPPKKRKKKTRVKKHGDAKTLVYDLQSSLLGRDTQQLALRKRKTRVKRKYTRRT